MLFNSFAFLLFFPVVTGLYFVLPHRFRWMMLLAASVVFYMAFIPAYILVLAAAIVIDYAAAIWIERTEDRKRRKAYLVISILSTCLLLFVFKYFNFFNTNLANLASILHWNYPIKALHLILPIGLSFHTFQSLSYVIEVYRGRQKTERHFGIYSLYVMFYPQLVAGPIERPQNLLHQFYERHAFEYARVTDGLKLMAWGLFKKIVIADRLAVVVSQVYGNPHAHAGVGLLVATVFFAFQIYCDFSGYSDIAIGAAKVMGFRLMQNFNKPYFSKSISEFWSRWHISLSTWFRDYVYIPLGGNRVAKWRWSLNLLISFLLSGLWHGANWTYVVWGGLNGLYLVSSIWTRGARASIVSRLGLLKLPTLLKILRVGATFALTSFAWIFFRAASLADAAYIVTHLFTNIASNLNPSVLLHTLGGLGLQRREFAIAIAAVAVLLGIDLLDRANRLPVALGRLPSWMRWAFWYAMVMGIVYFGEFAGARQFIYFQF